MLSVGQNFDSSCDEIVDPKVADINMAGLFGSGAAALYELYCTLVVLVYGDRWGKKSLANQEQAGP